MDLDALQKLCDEATPGPWKDWIEYRGARRSNVIAKVDDPTYWIGSVLPENSEFIAAARNELPKLIARMKKLEEVARIASEVDEGHVSSVYYEELMQALAALEAEMG